MIRIGDISLPSPVLLAPTAGIIDRSCRELVGASALVVSEMVVRMDNPVAVLAAIRAGPADGPETAA